MHVIQAVTAWVVAVIAKLGYAGLLGGMFGQAIGVPLPSEVMMAFGGFLAWRETLTLPLVIAVGTAGDTLGAMVAYAIGYYGGRPLLMKFGRLFFVRRREIDRADRWFERHGPRAVFICKLMPGIRAFASFPAGVTRMSMPLFALFTLLASAIWCTAFAGFGFVLGKNWEALEDYLRPISLLLIGLLVAVIMLWVWLHLRAERRQRPAGASASTSAANPEN